MKLKDLLAGLELLGGNADPEQEITGVSYDSRTTKPGDLFVAVSRYGVRRAQIYPHGAGEGRGLRCLRA